MKVAIVVKLSEDRLNLQNFIEKYCNEHHILAELHFYDDIRLLLKDYARFMFPLVFLDLYPEGDADGIELTRKLRKLNARCFCILLADTEGRAVDAYRVRAFDYILKPCSYERVSQSMRSGIPLLENFTDISSYIIVKESRHQVKILLSDIIYTDYYNHYIQIHTADRMIRSYLSFSEFSPMLLPHPCFLCCYRNCIVNMDHILRIENQDFLMDTGERIPLARRNRYELKQSFDDYTFRQHNRARLSTAGF
ncbi:MAG TPA: DNA-binding response regulator [Lachnospiraceae bacterium]|nr:DNA-binding response regulator [Lachnospiraceae bacterium]